MILIEEKPSVKLPCLTSLFINNTFYSKDVYDRLVQSENCFYDKTSNVFEFTLNCLQFLVDFLINYDDVKFVARKTKSKSIKKIQHKYKVKPYKHQEQAVEYGANRDGGWLLLDEQGLGKTGSIINLAEVLKKQEGLEHCFIICGVNGLKFNWANEIKKFSNLSYTILGQKVSRTGRISFTPVTERIKQLKNGIKEFFVITNIETLQNKDFANAFNKSRSKFDMIVLDEAHHCKSPTTASVKTLLKLKAKRCIALTGTVIMNVPEDCYVPLKWTGNTKSTFTQFKRIYNVYGGFGGVQVVGHKNLELLQELLSSCSLRRLKSEVLDLPDKTYQIEYVELGSKQQKLYDEVAQGIAIELDKLDHIPTILEEITINMRLRQITAYPGALSTEVTQSAKIDRLFDLVEDITSQGDKVVVFCTFKSAAEEVCKRLDKYGALLCTGNQTDDEINNNKKLFEENEQNKVLVCTWQKMGTGHTLISANYAIFLDTPWTDADFQQASDRIHRIGQNKKVFIITLIAKDTYDERVQEILERKECLSGYLVDNKEIV